MQWRIGALLAFAVFLWTQQGATNARLDEIDACLGELRSEMSDLRAELRGEMSDLRAVYRQAHSPSSPAGPGSRSRLSADAVIAPSSRQ